MEEIVEPSFDRRNRQLRALCEKITTHERVLHTRGERDVGYVRVGRSERVGRAAEKTLAKACGSCAFNGDCVIAFDLDAWRGVHHTVSTGRVMLEATGVESRLDFLQRLKEDTEASCVPPLVTQPDEIGRLGAINLEQLDELLLSLKTYWEYSNNKSIFAVQSLATINTTVSQAYEL